MDSCIISKFKLNEAHIYQSNLITRINVSLKKKLSKEKPPQEIVSIYLNVISE